MSKLHEKALALEKEKQKREEFATDQKGALKLVQEDILESFADENGEAWAQYQDGRAVRFSEVEAQEFEDWIRVTLHRITGAPRENWVAGIQKYLASAARRADKRKLYVRQAQKDGAFYLQQNRDRRLRITAASIEEEDIGTMFRLFNHQEPLVVNLKARIEDLDLLDKYTNFQTREEADLFKTVICVYGVPGIGKPIQLARGPPGSAKSTLNRITKAIWDPTTTMDRGIALPKDDGGWWVNCREHAILSIDNVNRLSSEDQDECCRIITGKNASQRKLYTNSGTVTGTIQAILCINGIDFEGLKSDFLDRSIIWELQRIQDDQRKEEVVLWQEFERDLPRIRGAIAKVLSKAIERYPCAKNVPELRLSDFGRWGVACAQARGQDGQSFADTLRAKVELQSDETLAQSWIMEPLQKFMEGRGRWEGSPKELLKALTEQEYGHVEGDGLHEHIVVRSTTKGWPTRPEAIGRELSRISFLLPRAGLRIVKRKRTGKQRHRVLAIESFTENAVRTVRQEVLSSENLADGSPESTCHDLSALSASGDPRRTADRWRTGQKSELSAKSHDGKNGRRTVADGHSGSSEVENIPVIEEVVHDKTA